MDDDETFSKYVADSLTELGIDDIVLANALSVSSSTVERWKTNKRLPHPIMRAPVVYVLEGLKKLRHEGRSFMDRPRTLTLPEVLEGAERAHERVSAWPAWKRELSSLGATCAHGRPGGHLCPHCGGFSVSADTSPDELAAMLSSISIDSLGPFCCHPDCVNLATVEITVTDGSLPYDQASTHGCSLHADALGASDDNTETRQLYEVVGGQHGLTVDVAERDS